jgi:hypothetical protein
MTERNIMLLFYYGLNNGHYDALLPVEEKRCTFSEEVCFNTQSLPKTFPLGSSTAYCVLLLYEI